MSLPTVVLTGASGFLGRQILDSLKERYRVVGIARRSQVRCGAVVHPNIDWHQVDIGDRDHLGAVFGKIRDAGGADVVLHLAAHYDFTGDNHPEYWRTNVDGLRNVLDLCRDLRPRRFVFSSSVAACQFPPKGAALNENSAPDGDHIYAQTKKIGEEMVREYEDSFPSTTVRFAAMFSDWCEYPPLFMFLSTWLSRAWNRGVLGGRGESAIPYMHLRDASSFIRALLERRLDAPPGEVLIASPDGAVSHNELYEVATRYHTGARRRSIMMPKVLCGPGMYAMLVLGRLSGEMPFERPWMAKYIDQRLTIDASRTRALLGWAPRPRLEIIRRMPFLLENRKAYTVDWNRRNRAAMKEVRMRPNLRIYWLLERHFQNICDKFAGELGSAPAFPTYRHVSPDERQWNTRVVLRNLMTTIMTRERSGFMSYCQDLAEVRRRQGFTTAEVCLALDRLDRVCIETLLADPESEEIRDYLQDTITMTIRFGQDQIEETFENLEENDASSDPSSGNAPPAPPVP